MLRFPATLVGFQHGTLGSATLCRKAMSPFPPADFAPDPAPLAARDRSSQADGRGLSEPSEEVHKAVQAGVGLADRGVVASFRSTSAYRMNMIWRHIGFDESPSKWHAAPLESSRH